MGQIIQIILAIPKIIEGLRALIDFAKKLRLEAQKRENQRGIDELANGDQRKLEEALGSSKVGSSSGHGVIVDSLPNVVPHKK